MPGVTGSGAIAALGRFLELMENADDAASKSKGTSIRVPTYLLDAHAEVAALGFVEGSFNRYAVALVLEDLEALAFNCALEDHFTAHPDARPSLLQVAIAGAALTNDPLQHRHDLIELGARRLKARDPEADADDVLLYATALLDAETVPA